MHPNCRCVPIELHEMEKPSFEVGDRIRMNEDGRKGIITKVALYYFTVDFALPSGEVTLTLTSRSFTVVFDDQPDDLRHFPEGYLLHHAAKAVKLDGPAAARTTE